MMFNEAIGVKPKRFVEFRLTELIGFILETQLTRVTQVT